MKFEKTFYVVVSTILITAFILVSYISSPLFSAYNTTNVTKIYYVDHISPTHRKIIEKFNKKYEGQIEVVSINLSFDKFSTNERKELLARYLRSKSDRIDIFAVDQIWVPRFAKWSVPLEKFFNNKQKENFLSYALESCYYNNQLVAAPLYIDISLLYYRPDLLKDIPDFKEIQKKLNESITWEEFISLKNEVDGDNPFYIFPAYDYEGLICQYIEMISGLGSTLIDGGNLKLDTPESEKSLQLLIDLVNKYKVSPREVLNFKEDPGYLYFEQNNGIFLRGWSSYKSSLKKSYNQFTSEKNVAVIPPPHFKGYKPVSVFGGWNLMISKYSSKLQESLTFLNYLISDDAQRVLYEREQLLPINNKLYYDSLFTNSHSELIQLHELMKIGIHRPKSEKYTKVSDILSYYLHQAIDNKISAKEALQKSTEQINSERILLK